MFGYMGVYVNFHCLKALKFEKYLDRTLNFG